jgi:hypothetical protein
MEHSWLVYSHSNISCIRLRPEYSICVEKQRIERLQGECLVTGFVRRSVWRHWVPKSHTLRGAHGKELIKFPANLYSNLMYRSDQIPGNWLTWLYLSQRERGDVHEGRASRKEDSLVSLWSKVFIDTSVPLTTLTHSFPRYALTNTRDGSYLGVGERKRLCRLLVSRTG